MTVFRGHFVRRSLSPFIISARTHMWILAQVRDLARAVLAVEPDARPLWLVTVHADMHHAASFARVR